MNRQTFGVLSVLVILLVIFSYSYSYIGQYVTLFTFLIVAFLSSPRTIVMDESGMRYNLGWKEDWNNIQSYKVEGLNIIFTTKSNKKRKISDIDKNALPKILDFLKNIYG